MFFSIRLLTALEAATFKAFRLKSLRDAPDAFHSTPEEWDHPLAEIEQRLENDCCFGAFTADGALVGIAILSLTARPLRQMRHKCEIWAVYVDGNARGKGLARQLVQRCVDEARSRGYEAIVLTASTHLIPVVKLYQSLGFVIYGTERGMVKLDDGRVIDDHLMELRLV
jgi:ribosomal protein S18 acetylase RimI-like enzyme